MEWKRMYLFMRMGTEGANDIFAAEETNYRGKNPTTNCRNYYNSRNYVLYVNPYYLRLLQWKSKHTHTLESTLARTRIDRITCVFLRLHHVNMNDAESKVEWIRNRIRVRDNREWSHCMAVSIIYMSPLYIHIQHILYLSHLILIYSTLDSIYQWMLQVK